jgi:malonyl CoA-acyl carrier protein transacylase
MAVSFLLKQQDLTVELSIAEEFWIQACSARDEFNGTPKALAVSKLHLMSQWLEFLQSKQQSQLLTPSLELFHYLLGSQDIHSALEGSPEKDYILSVYYSLPYLMINTTKSALLERENRSIYGLFGGQGPNEEYLKELQVIFNRYKSFVSELILKASTVLDMDILDWLNNEHPPIAFTASVAVSLPMIGVTQLCQYYVACKVLGSTPGIFRDTFKGFAGHSQGVISAVVASASDSFEDFEVHFIKAVKLLALIGKHSQSIYQKTFVDPLIVEDCIDTEGNPTPMLAINGAKKDFIQSEIDAINRLSDSTIEICLNNGPKNFVVAGPPKTLHGLILNLRKKRVIYF